VAGDEQIQQLRASSQEAHQYLPVNYPSSGVYRTAVVVLAAVMAVLGAAALVAAGGVPFAGREPRGWHQFTYNRATGVLLLMLAAVVLGGAFLPGRRRGPAVTVTGAGMLALGLLVLAVNRTPANVVAFSVLDVVAFWLLALGVLWSGMHLWESPETEEPEGRNLLGGHPSEHYRQAPAAGRTEESSRDADTD
jgi:peptidoglycan/LPS O-acetylase OafA/YrhL